MKIYYKDEDENFHLVNEMEAIQTIKFDEGVWHVRKILKGKEYTFVAERLNDLPSKIDLMSYLPYKYKIAQKIKHRLDEAEINRDYGINDKVKVGNIMKLIESVIEKVKE